jgi:hypothetical protein
MLAEVLALSLLVSSCVNRNAKKMEHVGNKETWAMSLGGYGMGNANRVVSDKRGNLFVAGTCTGKSGTCRSHDVVLVRIDHKGRFIWRTAVATGGSVRGLDYDERRKVLFLLTDNGVIAGIKARGRLLWKRQTGNELDAFRDLRLDSDGNIYITGSYSESSSYDEQYKYSRPAIGNVEIASLFDSGKNGCFIAKLDSNGGTLWVREAVGCVGWQTHTDVSLGGDVAFTGTFEGVAKLGSKVFKSRGGRDVFLAEFDPHGAIKNAHAYGGRGLDRISSISYDNNGNLWIVGFRSKQPGRKNENYIAKKTVKGITFYKSNKGIPYVRHVVSCGAGAVIASYSKRGPVITGVDQWGSHLWSKRIPKGDVIKIKATGIYGPGGKPKKWLEHHNMINGIDADKRGGIYLVGAFRGKMALDDSLLESKGSLDAFIWKMSEGDCRPPR